MNIARQKAFLFIGCFLIVILSVLTVNKYFPQIRAYFDRSGEIAEKQENLKKYQRISMERKAMEKNAGNVRSELRRAERILLRGETPDLAAVNIQNIFREISERANVEILTMRVLVPKEFDVEDEDLKMYIRIPVQISIRPTIRQLSDILFEIDASKTYLNVSDIRMRVVRGSGKEPVRTNLTLEGLMKKKERNG